METNVLGKAVMVLPGQGKMIRAYGDEVTFLLTGEQTGGRLTLFTDITPPGGGPPPHRHLNEDEWWVVQEGTASFFLDGEWKPVPAGGVVFAPRGSVHTFRNDGQTPLKMMISVSPSGFETFFQRSSAEFAKTAGPAMENIIAIAAEHGIEFV
jgi:quercetin dioxygenase-like cupin family protein